MRPAIRILAAALSALALEVPVQAYEPVKDWPCIQVKVPELSPAMMWAGPPIEGTAAEWKSSAEVTSTAKKIVLRRFTDEEVATHIETFAKSLDQADKSLELKRLFSATFDLISAERRELITGIERYTRRQRELADTVRKIRDELDTSLQIEDPNDEQMAKRREIENRLNWQTRIFDTRERSAKYVCEVPTLLEKRLFLIAREVYGHIED
jgi:hypothetical protein